MATNLSEDVQTKVLRCDEKCAQLCNEIGKIVEEYSYMDQSVSPVFKTLLLVREV